MKSTLGLVTVHAQILTMIINFGPYNNCLKFIAEHIAGQVRKWLVQISLKWSLLKTTRLECRFIDS